ncbi:hypothetical protein I5E97_13455 [Proteus hauseri]|uniref:Adhesin n=1 Tax=Proteus cibi TaxID=2050966 RepID=A0ABU6ECD0_9GAMM|nr:MULTISPECIES: hypothetical protein [Proteus]MBG6032037.1 hypothetical protein [Proteus hauseri]MEB6856726.1 hypothetical protein [Proteus cibi]MEB7087280.1 hypothetical protein [Proteus cibi]
MKIRTRVMTSLACVLAIPIFPTFAATEMGAMTLSLTGVIDMNVNTSQNQLVTGTLTGQTYFSATPIYSQNQSSSWSSKYAIISLSQQNYQCNANFVSIVPSQSNTYGLKLTHSSNPATSVYVTPKLNYSVELYKFGDKYQSVYAGQFFQVNPGVIDKETPNYKVCYVPTVNAVVPGGGTKIVSIKSPGSLPIYIDNNLTPGTLTYQGTPFFVGSFGGTNSADYYLKVNVTANIKVKRSCAITGVTNQQFNENMTHTNEIIRDSTFTLSCGGLGNPVNISAVVKEGTADATDPRKLVLAPINGTVSDKKPWVMGLPYLQQSAPPLTCNDTQNAKLLRFDNTDLELTGTNVGKNEPKAFGIRWALCKPDGTKAGEYRGKVDVNIFVRG